MNIDSGLWSRFSTGQSGDIFHFVQEATNSSKKQALKMLAGHIGLSMSMLIQVYYIPDQGKANEKANEIVDVNKEFEAVDEWLSYKDVPSSAPKFNSESHLAYMLKDNKLDSIYAYSNVQGELLGYSVRLINKENGSKQVLPVTYCHNEALEKDQWRLKGFTDQGFKPIYGIEKLAEDRKTILIVEGEKTAEKAQELLPELRVMS